MAGRLLLDTCTIIWSVEGVRSRISKTAVRELQNPERGVSASSISVAELAVLAQRRRITISSHWKTWFREAVFKNGWDVLSVTWEVIEEAYSLPGEFHGDPADRILVATARLHGLALVTPDRKLLDYPHVETIW